MPPLVTFIVVNWNGEDFLEDCLSSIFQQSYDSREVIVVDNGSQDRSREILGRFSEVRVIWNHRNMGFGAANNQALAGANGDYVAFVNNDVVLDSDWLKRILQPMSERDEVGMCAGKTMSMQKPGYIDNTGHLLYWDGLNRGRGRMQRDQGQFDQVQDAFFPSGCASLFRFRMLKEIGAFDEDFYLYGDDTELGIRARLTGWECAFVPSAVAYHHGSASLTYYHPLKFFFVERNRLWVALKYFPLELVLLNPLFSFIRYAFHFAALLLRKGVTGEFTQEKGSLLRLWWNAQIAAWREAPRVWKKRGEMMRKYQWKRIRFYRCFLRHRLGLKELAFTP
jgi:hypothetical protein